jgi:hypothetical protein
MAMSLIVPVGLVIGNQPNMPGSILFTFIGLGLGTLIAFVGLIQMLLRYQAEQERQRQNQKQSKE